MGQLVYTMFISNNCTLFHLWRKENLVKHQKVSKYYETDCSAILLPLDANFRSNSHNHPSNNTPSIQLFCWLSYWHGKNLTFLKQQGFDDSTMINTDWYLITSSNQYCTASCSNFTLTFLIWVGMLCWLHICKIFQTCQRYECFSIYCWIIELVVRILSKY